MLPLSMRQQMVEVARMRWRRQRIEVEITNHDARNITLAVYIWVDMNNRCIRAGCSKDEIGSRLQRHQKDLNRAASGKGKWPTQDEARRWVTELKKGELIAYVHQPRSVSTIVGELRPYRDVELAILRKYQPLLSNSRR